MRHHHALVAQARFAAESSGQFDHDLVPRLCGYLHSLANFQFSDGFGLKGKCEYRVARSNHGAGFVICSALSRKLFQLWTHGSCSSHVDHCSPVHIICPHAAKPPADSLTFNLATHLLTIASKRPAVRQQILDSIWSYLGKLSSFVKSDNGKESFMDIKAALSGARYRQLIVSLQQTTADKVCGFVLPSLDGLLAALETSSFDFQPRDFADLVSHSNAFLSSETSEQIRKAIATVNQDTQNSYARRVLSQYAAESNILSSNRVVLQVLTVKRNMIGRLLDSHLVEAQSDKVDTAKQNDAKPSAHLTFNDIWSDLLNTPVRITAPGTVDLTKIMRTEYIMSLQFITDMRLFANELLAQGSVSYEFYYSEIMGIALVSIETALM